jgi:hypothetical protein
LVESKTFCGLVLEPHQAGKTAERRWASVFVMSDLDSTDNRTESAPMKKIPLFLTAVLYLVAMAPLTAQAQTAGTYALLAAGTSGGEKGYCSVGTVTVREDGNILITAKNPRDRSAARRYSGSIDETSFSATSGRRRLTGTISYSGDQYAYGSYTAYFNSKIVGRGRFSMTRE